MIKGQEYQAPLEQRVLGFIQENQLVSSQHRLLIAVSGGPEQVATALGFTRYPQSIHRTKLSLGAR